MNQIREEMQMFERKTQVKHDVILVIQPTSRHSSPGRQIPEAHVCLTFPTIMSPKGCKSALAPYPTARTKSNSVLEIDC